MSKHSNKSGTKKLVIILLIMIAICSAILIIKIKATEHIDDSKQEEISDVLDTITVVLDDNDKKEEKTERMLQVAELQKENQDIIGWLEIDGTNISYPVLQGEDNDYYLTHTYKKEKNANGSIFLDKDYDFNKPSENLLIYGHRNKKGLMFDELIKYEKESFYKEHPNIRFTTEAEDSQYEIISVFKSRVYYQDEENVFRYYKFVNAENITDFNNYIDNAKEVSLYDTGNTATIRDQLLTLSTCEYSQQNGRFVVVAKKIK